MAAICRARLLSDLSGQTSCDKEATSADGRLCAYHSRQCQALYRGYKKRNAELDVLSENPPPYFKEKKGSIVSQEYADIADEALLKTLHYYLFKTYQLLDRVIRARKLHHSHFFAIDNDYGHQKYLDKLLNDKQNMSKALDKIGKRAATVMYEQKQWFDWVKETQAKEEREGETESRKVKLEALLFQRHQKEVKRQQREMMAKETQEQQEQYLDETYKQRLSDMSEQEQDDWDPIKDVYGCERENYVELIKYFLMLQDHESNAKTEDAPASSEAPQVEFAQPASPAKALSKSAKKRVKKANAETKKLADPTSQTGEGRGSNVIEMETRSEMRERLRTPVKYERGSGWYVQGIGPVGFDAQTSAIPADEIEQLLDEVAEIKSFIFCRLLLTQSTLLPTALKAESIEEFIGKEEVTRENLRDLCLKLERPGLQDVRDACADFIRERDGVEDLEDLEAKKDEEVDDYDDTYRTPEKYRMKMSKGRIPEQYKTKREKAAKKAKNKSKSLFEGEDNDGAIDFGKVTDESRYARKRTRIKICGRYMYNYPSEKSLTRGGWYHFSIIAKDSDLHDAVELCRNWNEFFELNILCLYQYFPAPKWTRFIGDLPRQQLLQLGFIPYFHADKAEAVTNYFQTGSRGMTRRAHQHTEMRNFVCGHIKRDDPISRRFIQYLAMESWELRALVRDAKTGKVLISPPESELWLVREKSGWGRASRNEYEVLGEVGPKFFESMDKSRRWHFGFEEFYDVYIWDSSPGRSFFILQRKIEEVLTRAMRVRDLKDMFNQAAPILKTLYKEPESDRVRSIKPGEEVESIWHGLDTSAQAWSWSPNDGFKEAKKGFEESYKYTEADELEDAILFPYEKVPGLLPNDLYRNVPSAMEMFETDPIDLRRFAGDLDTDEEVESSDGTDLGEVEDDDDSDWEDKSDDDYEYTKGDEAKGQDPPEFFHAIDILTDQFKSTFGPKDYFLPILRDPKSKRAKAIPKAIRTNPADLMGVCRFALRCQQQYDHSHKGMEADFLRHIDRQKSKAFKQSFHLGDTEPGTLKRYVEHRYMVDAMDAFIMEHKINTGPFELCQTMDMASLIREERRIVDDAFIAYASIALFFEGDAFLASDLGESWRDTKLLDQEERAKYVPDRRTHMSNKSMPQEFWKGWDDLLKENRRHEGDCVDDIYPMEWRKAIRSVVVKLFKAGIICASYGGSAAGIAIAAAEPGRELDMYIDFRVGIPLARVVSHLVDPRPLDRDFIVKMVQKFKADHPAAKFSVLRLWSSPQFYPLMLGYDKREMCSFLDDRGRCWEFKFIPKDMPYSEWSVHQQLLLRLQPFEKVWGKQVWIAKDLIIVMGKDEKELRRFSEGATWIVQTKPWRLEVDFWRSFILVAADRETQIGQSNEGPFSQRSLGSPSMPMHLTTAPELAAEVPGCAQEQLDRLARSVEARRQQLEEDINAYIARKQDELRQYESELVEQLCSLAMEKERADDDDLEGASLSSRRSSASAASDSTSTERTEDVTAPSPSPSHSQHHHTKQKKHGRVHKREKELYGLVTPVFLPLLDAREATSPEKSHSHSHNHTSHTKPASLPTDTSSSSTTPPPSEPATPASNAPQSPNSLSPRSNLTAGAMPGETATSPAPFVKERSASDPGKKSRRSSIKKKSALRHNSSTPRSRKRVSLVIDDQVVLPSDVIQEPTLMSPGDSETTSATTSTASLDDMIDPRLTADNDEPMYIEHTEAVHHSLPPSIPVLSEKDHSPPTPNPRSPTTTAFAPPSYATRTFLDPPVSERIHIEETAGPGAIYPDVDDKEDQIASSLAAAGTTTIPGLDNDTEHFETYVGGISGSGVADVNQVGSVGYPSSLGASYLESYMQGRPLSVRMAAAEREGDEGEIKRLRGLEERRKIKEREAARAKEKVVEEDEEDWGKPAGKGQAGGDDDDGFMGSMDDF
ncbi:hypothetical protein E8E13_003449 [Curvularia kusanoi]|uniref:Uncharacterized protein n=1 Tax=Curvularia kusanoi TaxID=90978 RepID=A0A9P4T6H1_CURKU|nr:hypothetical protein E8E13_003449 [Curvularia kusanoi]